MKSMVKETEKRLSASIENYDQLIIQVHNLRDELEDRDITIRIMAQAVSTVIIHIRLNVKFALQNDKNYNFYFGPRL